MQTSPKKQFKQQFSLEERRDKFQQNHQRYPDMIPLIIERHPKSSLPVLSKYLYLVGKNFKFPNFRAMLRKNFELNEKSNIFFYSGTLLIAEDSDLQTLYDQRKDPQDNFLYIQYSDLEVFGA